METFALYLFKSSVWLTGFSLIYFLFLRNERFFVLNRIYLVSGILVSILFPLFTWHYTVVFPVTPTVDVLEPQVLGVAAVPEPVSTQNLLLYIYLIGALFLIFRLIKQTTSVLKVIRKSETLLFNSVKLIQTDRYPAPFSFFSYVFVNPSIDETETNEILNHEQEHIRQQHWIDLLLFEILCITQWFNPASWLYGHFIRQNHEYLADERAIKRSSNPAVYRAALLNQMFDGSVISLANSFNYSLNKKRFNMMKQTISSPIRKLKLLLVLPLIAGVFYAFAAPEYKFAPEVESSAIPEDLAQTTWKTVKGKVVKEDGTPLRGTSIVVSGSTIGTLSDSDGNFTLKVPNDSPLVFSFVGFKFVKINPDFDKEMLITMNTVTIFIDAVGNDISESKPKEIPNSALIVIDGKETTKAEMEKINPETIESINVLKGKPATNKYGEKGKDGVVLITTKKKAKASPNTPTDVKVVGYGQTKDIKENSSDHTTSVFKIRSTGTFDGSKPLIVINGVIAENQNMDNIDPETIESISVLKDEATTKKYGDKGKNGVLEITLKKEKEVFIVVEQMPEFPGGIKALKTFVATTMKYPVIALENRIQGQVHVSFVVAENGSVTDAKIERGVDPSLDQEALRIVNGLPKWKPGLQRGMPVRVSYSMPINFTYPADYHPKNREKLREKK